MPIVIARFLGALTLCAGAACQVPALAASVEESYTRDCAVCHLPGISGAPKVGDKAEWSRRVRPGMATVYRNAIEGIPFSMMSPKGGQRDLSDDEVKAIVAFMVAASGVDRDALSAAARYEKLGITDRDFISLDADFDGLISAKELSADPVLLANLNRFDSSRDGKLSPTEYRNAETTLERERAAIDVPDDKLAAAVRAAVLKVPGIEQSTRVEAAQGTVAIIGMVGSSEIGRQAHAAAKRVSGVRKIDNRLVSAHQMSWD